MNDVVTNQHCVPYVDIWLHSAAISSQLHTARIVSPFGYIISDIAFQVDNHCTTINQGFVSILECAVLQICFRAI